MKRWWVVVALVVVVAGGFGLARYREQVRQRVLAAREQALKDNLNTMRKAIQNFHADKGRYPTRLEELVPNYMRRIPKDPMTEEESWRLITEEVVETSRDFTTDAPAKSESVIVDVRSLAPGYSEY